MWFCRCPLAEGGSGGPVWLCRGGRQPLGRVLRSSGPTEHLLCARQSWSQGRSSDRPGEAQPWTSIMVTAGLNPSPACSPHASSGLGALTHGHSEAGSSSFLFYQKGNRDSKKISPHHDITCGRQMQGVSQVVCAECTLPHPTAWPPWPPLEYSRRETCAWALTRVRDRPRCSP